MRTGNEIELDAVQIMEGLVRGLIRFKDDLRVETVNTLRSKTITVTAHADDTPKIIGSQGVNFKAIQKIADAIGEQLSQRITFVVTDPVVGQRFSQEKFKTDASYDPAAELDLLEQIGWSICDGDVRVEWVKTNDQSGTIMMLLDGNKMDYDPELEVALDTIFNAIGKAKGFIIHVELDSL